MKRLEDIPKENIFQVPEGYFDKLPMKVQARLETGTPRSSFPFWNYAVRYALPIIIIGVALAYYFRPASAKPEDLLAEVSNEHLIVFLKESEINEHDLLEIINFNQSDVDSLSRHLNDALLGDFDLDSYRDEVKGALENEL